MHRWPITAWRGSTGPVRSSNSLLVNVNVVLAHPQWFHTQRAVALLFVSSSRKAGRGCFGQWWLSAIAYTTCMHGDGLMPTQMDDQTATAEPSARLCCTIFRIIVAIAHSTLVPPLEGPCVCGYSSTSVDSIGVWLKSPLCRMEAGKAEPHEYRQVEPMTRPLHARTMKLRHF